MLTLNLHTCMTTMRKHLARPKPTGIKGRFRRIYNSIEIFLMVSPNGFSKARVAEIVHLNYRLSPFHFSTFDRNGPSQVALRDLFFFRSQWKLG